ncbi:unnamed protein product [Dovyalis caffra]|uniref:Uncharacterized protein n=1 Tax=Dovyalis caffra TaxID=77055 RepID=A0AAV1R145_9ROSI|nr:unnamed protein product [Dovyalis caffra]
MATPTQLTRYNPTRPGWLVSTGKARTDLVLQSLNLASLVSPGSLEKRINDPILSDPVADLISSLFVKFRALFGLMDC